MGNNLVKRTILDSLLAHLDQPEITLLVGPRQSGKTTLVGQLREELEIKRQIARERIYYFNLDVFDDSKVFADQTVFINFLKGHLSNEGKIYVFVDEAQRVEDAGRFFKGVYDLKLPVKLILTGSSSLEIRQKIVEPLTGRKKLFTLYPFSFSEFIDNDNLSLLSTDVYSLTKIWEKFYQFIIFGGYPKVAMTTNSLLRADHLEEIYTSYLEKDVVGLAKIRDQYVYSHFVKMLAQEAGDMFNAESTAKELNFKAETADKYLDLLEKTFIANRLPPYFRSARAEIRKMPKIYFLDNGLRNYALEGKNINSNFTDRQDRGKLLENFIYSEIVKAGINDVSFWRTKDDAEVDFVVKIGDQTIPVEIKASVLKEDDLTRSYVSFLSRYHPKVGYVVNLEMQGVRDFNETEVRFVLPFQLTKYLQR